MTVQATATPLPLARLQGAARVQSKPLPVAKKTTDSQATATPLPLARKQ